MAGDDKFCNRQGHLPMSDIPGASVKLCHHKADSWPSHRWESLCLAQAQACNPWMVQVMEGRLQGGHALAHTSIDQLLALVLAYSFEVHLCPCDSAVVQRHDMPERAADAALLPLHGRSAGQERVLRSRGARYFTALAVHCTVHPVFVCITALGRKLIGPGSLAWRGHAFARVAHHQRHRKSRQRCSTQLGPKYFLGERST